MYKLLKDKNNEFQCEIKLEGASASSAKVRLFLEGDECEYVFTGKIEDDQCIIPLGRLKKFANLLEQGKIRLEVVADDTLFVPYESDYKLEAEKKVTVEVREPGSAPKKTVVEVKVTDPKPVPPPPAPEVDPLDPIRDLKKYLNEHTYFTGTLQSFKTVIKQPKHRDYFNRLCEENKLDKKVVIKKILS